MNITESQSHGSNQAIAPPSRLVRAVLAACCGLAVGCSGTAGGPTPVLNPAITASTSSALMGATRVEFSLSGTGTGPVECSWEFGDGSVASGATASHVYEREGTFEVAARITAQGTSATARSTVTVRSVAGSWRGTPSLFLATLTQSGAAVGGTFRWQGFDEGTASGRASHPSNLEILFHRPGQFQLEFSGSASTSVDTIAGTYRLCRDGGGGCTEPMPVTFRRD